MIKINVSPISDPSHGWYAVHKEDITSFFAELITMFSHYSYMDKSFLYLEEDCDFPLLHSTAENKGYEIKFLPDFYSDSDSFVRNLKSFKPF